MASTANTFVCAALAVLLWSAMGLPLAARIAPRSLAWALAPAIGWAVHSALALPLLSIIGMSRTTVAVMMAVCVIAALVALWATPQQRPELPSMAAACALVGAALLAIAVMAAVLPKISDGSVALAPQIFDHSKVAMIDEMMRNGVPPGNPFFGEADMPRRLTYYYLWHFSAGEIALLAGASGWEADAGLSWFTAFASLSMLIGSAAWLSRPAAAIWVVALAATGSLRPIASMLLGQDSAARIIGWQGGFGSWQFQSAWAPQHLAGAICAVLAAFLLARLAQRLSLFTLLMLAIVSVACFESSSWIGAVVFPLAAVAIVLALLMQLEPHRRLQYLLWLVGGAVIALALASPMIYDQYVTTTLRGAGSPIALVPYEVLGEGVPANIRRIADLPAFWLVFLLIEWPACYVTGTVTMVLLLKQHDLADDRKQVVRAFALLAFVGLCVSWLLASTFFSNNDLGWRAALPAAMVLIVFAAVGLTRVVRRPISAAAVGALGLIVLAVPDGANQIYRNFIFEPQPSAKLFAATPAMWQAVRRHAGTRDRVANNPLFLGDMVPWTINISWALLSNRRSCYPGAGFAGPFTALSENRRHAVDAQFLRVFAGTGTPEDIAQLGSKYQCRLVVLTAQDGAWTRDPFAANPSYRLVESEAAAWRIYEYVGATGEPRSR